jgi:hypothetical protein
MQMAQLDAAPAQKIVNLGSLIKGNREPRIVTEERGSRASKLRTFKTKLVSIIRL